jgi:hypothetical protein
MRSPMVCAMASASSMIFAAFEIDRNDYNVNFSKVLETGGVMVGDRVSIQLDILATLQQH